MANETAEQEVVMGADGVKFDKGIIESKASRSIAIAGVVALIGSLAIYILRLDRVVGLVVDDAWYVMLAKSLATGQGYSLINSPSPGILPLYPPGFPFLLSLVYRLSPNFPENVWLLKSVSIAAMIVSGVLIYRYFLHDRKISAPIALGIALATTLCPPLVFLATSTVMSDCVFMLTFLLTVVVTERCAQAGRSLKGVGYTLLAAALSSFAFLTRSIAIALVMAVILYLLKERLIRSAAIFTVVVAALIGPWMMYSRAHTPTLAQQQEQAGNMVLPYSVQFWQRVAGDESSGEVGASALPARVLTNSLEFLGRDVCRILMAVVFEALRDPFKEAERLKAAEQQGSMEIGVRGQILPFSLFLGLFVIIGFIAVAREKITMAEIAVPASLAVITLWPFETIRYVLPMAPFVIFYFLAGARWLQRLVQRSNEGLLSGTRWGLAQIALGAIIAFSLYGNGRYILNLYSGSSLDTPQWIRSFEEAETLFARVDQLTPKTAIIATTNPALITLYTGRKTVTWTTPTKKWEIWKKLPVDYLVWVRLYPGPVSFAESRYRTVYRSREGSDFRIVDLGPAESRPAWDENPGR
jgi:hypothetical protein